MLALPEPVVMEAEAPVEQVEAVELALREAGIDTTVEAVIARRGYGAGVLPWLVKITLGSGFAAFCVSIGKEAGKDAYNALKSLIAHLLAARSDGDGQIEFYDDEYNVVCVRSELPDEAMRALFEIDWSEMRASTLVWKDGEWYNATPMLKDGE